MLELDVNNATSQPSPRVDRESDTVPLLGDATYLQQDRTLPRTLAAPQYFR